MPDSWGDFTGTTIVKVAIIDGGLSKYHSEISPILITQGEWDYVDEDADANDESDLGHGTKIAGIIAALKNNSAGISGISDRVRILPIRTADSDGFSDSTDNAFAIERAVDNGCRIINCSFGGPYFSNAQNTAINYANRNGVLIVCGAGNESSNNDISPLYPACYPQPNIISVANTTSLDNLSESSNFGASSVDIAAPGTDIYTTAAGRRIIKSWLFERKKGDNGWSGWSQPYSWPLGDTSDNDSVSTINSPGGFYCDGWRGLFTRGKLWLAPGDNQYGLYHSGSSVFLDSDYIDCSNYENLKVRFNFNGYLAYGDWLRIYTYDDNGFSSDTSLKSYLGLVSAGDITGGQIYRAPALDKIKGKVRIWFASDYFANGYFGLLDAEVTGLYANSVTASSAFTSSSGTSFSAPIIVGVAAMLMSQNPKLSHLQVKDVILQTARKVSALNGKVVSGGIVDAVAALREANAIIVLTPTITGANSVIGTVGSSLSYTITASDSPTSYNASGLPSGMTVNTWTGEIFGTPTMVGATSLIISASNGAGTGSATLTISVAKGTPLITAAPTASVITYGQSLFRSILSGGLGSVAGSFAFTMPSATPSAGTPSHSVTFTPTDTVNYNTVTTTVSVTINKATPSITSIPTASAITSGQNLASSTLSGGSGSVAGSFAFTTPSATPSAGTASHSVTFTPTDTVNYNTVQTMVKVTVNLAISSDLSAASLNLGSNYSYQITAHGSPTSFGARGLPAGLTINTRTGLISGRPTRPGTFSVTLQALKKGSATVTATKVFTVVQVPTFSYAATINAKRNSSVNVRPKVAGSPAPSFSVVSGSLPPGLSLNASTAAITGTPTTTGTYPFTVRGSNSAGNTDRSTTIVVK
jgi:hypothetical protein